MRPDYAEGLMSRMRKHSQGLPGIARSSVTGIAGTPAIPMLTLLAVLASVLLLLLFVGPLQAQEAGNITHPENDSGTVATFRADDPEGKDVTFSVAAANTDFSAVEGIGTDDAADAAHFEIDEKTGVLTFAIGDDEGPPDFEMPRGTAIAAGNTNEYKVVIAASDGAEVSYHAVTVEVLNEEEDATTGIELTSIQPRAGVEITVAYVDGVGNPFVDATGTGNTAIVDPDGSKADTTVTTIPDADVTWQWSKSSSKTGPFTDIAGDTAKTKSYTPDAGDVNRYLRLTASYEDGQGEGKTVMATSDYRVLASRTNNSDPGFQNDFDPTTDGDQEPAAMLDDGATAGDNVGDPITASDAESDRLTYSFDTTSPSADLDVFQIDRATGQVTVGLGKTVSPAGDTGEPAAVTKQATFTVIVKATDSHGASDTATLTITMKETDEAPVFTDGKLSHEFEENATTAVYTFAAYDPEQAGTVTYAVSGADASKFSITAGAAGELTFLASPDFEARGSADSNNVYRLMVKASDASTPAKSKTLDVTVEVTNEDEDGTVSLSASQPRIGVEIRANTPVDPDGGVTNVTWQWSKSSEGDSTTAADCSSGNVASLTFGQINGATMAGYTPVGADDGNCLRATASYTDAQGSGKSAMVTLAQPIQKVRNLAPMFTDEDDDTLGIQINPRAVSENSAAATPVTDPKATDATAAAPVVATDTADADTTDDTSIFYSLSGADAASFDIDSGTGQISVGANTKLDYEDKKTYTVRVTARDPEGLSSYVDVTINVTPVDEGPEISGPDSEMHPENDSGTVATFRADDPEGKDVTFSVAAANTDFSAVEGIGTDDAADAAHFEIDEKTGVLTFAIGDDEGPPDFEMPRGTAIAAGNTNEYKVVIAASDGAEVSYHAVTVEVLNEEEDATTGIELTSIQPRAGVEITVAYVDGVGNPFVDATGTGNTAIVDPDGSKADTTVTTIPDADVTWQWSKSSSKTGPFTDIAGDTAKTKSYTPDAGDVNRYLRLTASYEDGQGEGKTVMATSDYRVLASRTNNSDPGFQNDFDPTTDGDQEPAAMLDDGATAGDNVGDPITASDAESDRLTYSFDTTSPSADLDVFQIDRATGQVTVGLGKTVSPAGDTGEPAAVTKQATFTVIVKATDSHGASDTATLTITMKETDEAPVFTDGKLSHEFEENATTAVYTFAAYDPEQAGTVTYAVSGADASKFSITAGAAGELTFLASPDFEARGSADSNNVYRLMVKASDASTPAKSKTLDVTVEVTNEDEDGTVSLSASQPRIGVEIRANTPVDPDGGVTNVTWQWSKSSEGDSTTAADCSSGNVASLTFGQINGATMAGYTPVGADDGNCLRATASYTDAQGSGKSAMVTLAQPIQKVRNLAPMFTDEDDDTLGIQINPRAVPENSAAGHACDRPQGYRRDCGGPCRGH